MYPSAISTPFRLPHIRESRFPSLEDSSSGLVKYNIWQTFTVIEKRYTMHQKFNLKIRLVLSVPLFWMSALLYGQPSQAKRILFVVTSHSQKGNTGAQTGYFLSEVSHPWAVLHDAGYSIDFVSPQGGNPPVDAFNLKDSVNNRFWHDRPTHMKLTHSRTPAEVDPKQYLAIFYAGGHGAMWDFPGDSRLAAIAGMIYDQGGIVSAVCHGPAGLIHVKLANGRYLISGKKVSGFTDQEEKARHLEKVVPFLLEDKLKQRGGIFEQSAPFTQHIAVDGRLITGQNPASSEQVEGIARAAEIAGAA